MLPRTFQLTLATALLATSLTLGGCASNTSASPQSKDSNPSSVATVNGEQISQKQLDEELNRKYGQEVLNNLVDDRLIEQAGKKENIKVTDADVKSRLDEIKRSPQYIALVKQRHMTDADLEQYLHRLIILQKLILLEIPEQEKLKVFDYNKEALEEAHVYHIMVEPTKKSDAEKIADQIKKGKDFEAAAREFSKDDNSKLLGGDLGWISRGGTLDPNLTKVVFTQPINQVSQPIKSRFGWHLIKVTGRKKTYDELKQVIEDTLVGQRQMEYLQRLRVKADIKTKFDKTQASGSGSPAPSATASAKG